MGDLGLRLNWIKQRLCDLLKITDDAVFNEFMERDMGRFKQQILQYLAQTQNGSDIALLFYTVSREEEERVEVEIESEPASRHSLNLLAPTYVAESSSFLTAEGSDISGVSSAASDMKGKKGKGRKGKGSRKKAEEEAKRAAEVEAARAAAEAELLQQEGDYEDGRPRTKIVIQKVLRNYLYMLSGMDISFELVARANCVIFLRTQVESLDINKINK